MNWPQLIISIPLLFVLFFGLGFIFNMILRTTWFPMVIYAGIILYVGWGLSSIFSFVNMVLLLASLAGVIMGIWTIRLLRAKGYRMF